MSMQASTANLQETLDRVSNRAEIAVQPQPRLIAELDVLDNEITSLWDAVKELGEQTDHIRNMDLRLPESDSSDVPAATRSRTTDRIVEMQNRIWLIRNSVNTLALQLEV